MACTYYDKKISVLKLRKHKEIMHAYYTLTLFFYQNHSGMSWAQGTNKNVDQKIGLKAYIFNNISFLNKDHYKILLAPL